MDFPISGRLSLVELSAVVKIKEQATALEAAGDDLVYLLRGEPDFPTPPHIVQAANEALLAGHTHYPPPLGIRPLRQAIAERVSRDFHYMPDPDAEILVTTGATMGIYIALQAIVEPGDEVILFDPSYDPYASAVRLAGGKPVAVKGESREGHFTVSLEQLEAAINGRTRAILFSNPWNPTGTVMTRAELEQFVALAEAHNLLLIVDEIYEHIIFDDHTHVHLAALSPAARTRTITLNSFSKSYAMTGWRLGYTLAAPPLIEAMMTIAQQFSRSAATFVQHAGVAALRGSQAPVAEMQAAYARRRQIITDALQEAGLTSYRPPEGTFFAFVDVRPLGGEDQAIADRLLHETGVVTVPGSVYGPAGAGFLRLSFATNESTLMRAMERILNALKRIG